MEDALIHLKEECNFKNRPRFIRHLHGGDINTVYLIEAEEQQWVVKQNNAIQFPLMLEKEYRAMQFLHQNSPLYYPKMLCHFTKNEQQFLVMEYVEEGPNNNKAQQHLGKGLAQQHRLSNSSFGWKEDNYIGSLKQVNTFKESWNDFFAENRLLFQAEQAFNKRLLVAQDLKQLERLCLRLNEMIPTEPAALLHGDLWAGNYIIGQKNQPVLYDPAIYYGHREMDLAMTQLFGGFSTDFYMTYQEVYPLVKDWEERVKLFQLYPNLVHLNLFGASYLDVVRKTLKKH